MTAVISAEESWANNLLRPLSARAIRGSTAAERRLLILNLFAGRVLALAVWLSLVKSEETFPVESRRLLQLLDDVYFARTMHEEYRASERLDEEIRRAVYGRRAEQRRAARSREQRQAGSAPTSENATLHTRFEDFWQAALVNRKVPKEYRFLLRWMAPTAFGLQGLQRDRLSGSLPEGLRERYRFVHQLHLAAHLRLVRLTPLAFYEDKQQKNSESIPADPRRHFVHEALFRYLVCRTHHWQLATQQGRTTGLRYFKEYYDSRQRRLSGVNRMQRAELTFDRLRQWHGLRVLEGRVAPPTTPQDLVHWIRAYARGEDRRIRKFGIVVHFKKEDEDQEERGFSNRIERPVPRLRWGRRRRILREEGMRLYRLLQRPTPVTPFVVGIDACNLELSTPPEVFAPVFRFLRELPISMIGSGRQYSPYFELEPAIRHLASKRRLGMTYHVGEDFRHLLSGLRAIYEVIEFLHPHPGDRLGHGTALALHPKDWLHHNVFQAVLPKLEWLDTLVWVHHFLGPGDDVVGVLGIEDKIQRFSWDIYSRALRTTYDPLGLRTSLEGTETDEMDGRNAWRGFLDWNWSPLTLWDGWKLRQIDPYTIDLRKLLEGRLEMTEPRGFCEEERRWRTVQGWVIKQVEKQMGSRNAYLLLALYLMSPQVRKEGDKAVVVDMQEKQHEWLELCRRVEERMKTLIHKKELVVEVNPSSNRIIGPMERYAQHHVFHLTLDENRRLSRQVRVSVNTDNPAVCHTTLAHEHYLLGEILMREVPEAEVIEWLEWLRLNGVEYNFVRRLRAPEDNPEMGRLVEWLRGIRPSVLEERTRGDKLAAFWGWLRDTRLRLHGLSRSTSDAEHVALERLWALERQLRNVSKALLPKAVPGEKDTAAR